MGVPYTLVTGVPLPDQFIENVLATPQTVLASEKFERFDAVFSGAGDTLSAALAALVAGGTDLAAAATEALAYLDRCLDGGFRPGMGHVVPDRLFWAQPEADDADERTQADGDTPPASTSPRMTPSTRPQPAAVRPRPRADPRRREFARARLPRRRRHAALRAARAGRLLLGRQRQPLHRLHRLLGPDDPGPRPSARARGGAAGGARRLLLRRADRARDRTGRGDRAPPALRGDGAAGELGHRGGDERDPAGARRHRPQPHHQVRGLLPRPCRRAAGEGRLRPGHLRPSRPAPACRRRWCSTRWSSNTTTSRSSKKPSPLHGERPRLRDHRADRRQHELRARQRAVHAALPRAVHAARRAAGVRRGDDRLPRRPGRRAGRLREGDPRLPARHHGAGQGDRRRHAAGGLRRPARDHGAAGAARAGLPGRHARRAIRWPRPAAWRRCRRSREPGFYEALAAQDAHAGRRPDGGGGGNRACPSPPIAKAACSASSCCRSCRRTMRR